jgi:hypothetical protein
VYPQFRPNDFANGRRRGVQNAGLAVRAVLRRCGRTLAESAQKGAKVDGKLLLLARGWELEFACRRAKMRAVISPHLQSPFFENQHLHQSPPVPEHEARPRF